MVTFSSQLITSIDAVIFDCDGTLSRIEGIDELAKNSTSSDLVHELTADAMTKSGLNPELYQKRLELVQPTLLEVMRLGRHYIEEQTEAAFESIQLLKRLGKTIYILSAGVNPAVCIFGEHLGVARENIFAVDLQFDIEGSYQDFDKNSPLVYRLGKREIVEKLKWRHPQMAYVGDGMNDIVVMDLVRRFIGYGGAFFRENLADLCDYYSSTASMAAILPLILTVEEVESLSAVEQLIYQTGMAAIEKGYVKVS